MRILYDLWAAQPLQGDYHGGGTHALAILERLVNLRGDRKVTAFYDESRWLDPEVVALLERHEIPLIDVRGLAGLQSLIKTGGFDRLYSSLPYDMYDLDLGRVDFVLTIHGLRQIETPSDRHEWVYADGWARRWRTALRQIGVPFYVRRQRGRLRRLVHANARSTSIIVPSMHSKHALLNTFQTLDPAQVTVCYSPLREQPHPPDEGETQDVLRDFGVSPREFFLIVNAGRWIKNAYRALVALDRFFSSRGGGRKKVVVLGVQKGQSLERALANPERFAFHDYVPAGTLLALYREAFALVYPTLNEGFGYPPLEAMRWGTPVICSAVTSLPEVCDSAALYCNPLAVDEIQNRVSQLVLEPEVWREYAERGLQRFSEMEALQRESLDRICHLVLGGAVEVEADEPV